MNATMQVDSSTFDLAVAALVKLTGRSQKDVIENEAKMILQKATKDTKAADTKLINRRYTYPQNATSPLQLDEKLIAFVTIDGKKVRVRSVRQRGVWETTPKGKRVFRSNKVNPLWKKVKAKLASEKKRAKGNRGQSKATWVYIGKRLGLKVDAPGYVMKALEVMPRSLKNKLFGADNGEQDFTITIENSGRTVLTRGADGRHAFNDAWKGRANFFRTNVEKGVFTTAKKTLAKYPGLKVED